MPTAERHTRAALPSVAPHSGPSFRLGLGLPPETISGRFCRAKATLAAAVLPPAHRVMSTLPFRYRTNVAIPSCRGAYVRPPIAKPPPESDSLKPLLNVATSFER